MHVVIDSSVICADYRLTHPAFDLLKSECNHAGHKLYVPKLVLSEVKTKFAEHIRQLKNDVDVRLGRIGHLVRYPIVSPLSETDADVAIEQYAQFLRQWCAAAGAVILDIPSIPHEAVVERILSRKRPFRSDDRGYRDYLLWHNVLWLAQKCQGEGVAVLTHNSADFCDNQGGLHPDLVADVRALTGQTTSVQVYGDVEAFVNQHVRPALVVLDGFRHRMSYDGFNLEEYLAETVPERLADMRVEEERDWPGGYDGTLGRPHERTVVRVSDVYDFSVCDARLLSSGEVSVEIECWAHIVPDAPRFEPKDEHDETEVGFLPRHGLGQRRRDPYSSNRVYIMLYVTYEPRSHDVTELYISCVKAERDL